MTDNKVTSPLTKDGKLGGTLISKIIFALLVLLIIVSVAGFSMLFYMRYSGTEKMDNKFGDQHLKMSMALIELHKVRFGKYPPSLDDIKYVGNWDRRALRSVIYYPSDDLSAYYLEVTQGLAGKPLLNMPDEFWEGMGYNESLKPKSIPLESHP